MRDLCVEDVLINEQLLHRQPRAARLDLEIEALHDLMQRFVLDSSTFMDSVVEAACRLCGGDSAGISLEDTLPDGTKIVRWVATTGFLVKAKDQWLPRERTPCATVMDRDSPQLFSEPHRVFTDITTEFAFREGLLVPWRLNNEMRGTLWVMSHQNEKHFDREDVRLLESLTTFAQAAVWKHQVEVKRREHSARTGAAELANALAHEINNPLQALTNSLHLLSFEACPEVLAEAQSQLARISELVQGILTLEGGSEK